MHMCDAGGDDAAGALRRHRITAERADGGKQQRHCAHDSSDGKAAAVGGRVAGHDHVADAVCQLEVRIVSVGTGQTQLHHHNLHKCFLKNLKQNKTAAR